MSSLHGPESPKVLISSSDLTKNWECRAQEHGLHHSVSSTARNFRFTDVLDVALISGARSVSFLDIAAPVEKQIKTFNSWEPTHRGTRIGQMPLRNLSITAPVYRSTGFSGLRAALITAPTMMCMYRTVEESAKGVKGSSPLLVKLAG